MEEVLQELKKINQRLDGMDARFDAIDERFAAVDERFTAVDERLEQLSEANQVTRDLIKDMELRFERLEAGQKDIRADIAGLRRELFLESGSREYADTTQGDQIQDLERRVAALEALQGLTPQAA